MAALTILKFIFICFTKRILFQAVNRANGSLNNLHNKEQRWHSKPMYDLTPELSTLQLRLLAKQKVMTWVRFGSTIKQLGKTYLKYLILLALNL